MAEFLGFFEKEQNTKGKNTEVAPWLFFSREYRRKFDSISSNKKLNRKLYILAKRILKHRSGTEFEDMYWLDADTAEIVAQELSAKDKLGIDYSSRTKALIANNANLVTIHSHPNSCPPSLDDFISNFEQGYQLGIVCCHDGKVYIYRANGIIDEKAENAFNLFYSKFYWKDGKTMCDVQLAALEKIKEYIDISYREVK